MYLHFPVLVIVAWTMASRIDFSVFSVGFPGDIPGCVPTACTARRSVDSSAHHLWLDSSRTLYFCMKIEKPSTSALLLLFLIHTQQLDVLYPYKSWRLQEVHGCRLVTQGQQTQPRSCLLTNLGRGAAELGKHMPILFCEELEPCPSVFLAGCFLNTWFLHCNLLGWFSVPLLFPCPFKLIGKCASVKHRHWGYPLSLVQ